jgi:hypothetical protein
VAADPDDRKPEGYHCLRDPMDKDNEELRHARHNLGGRLNAIKLCVSALEMVPTRREKLEFLDMIDQAADRALAALDKMEQIFGQAAQSPP